MKDRTPIRIKLTDVASALPVAVMERDSGMVVA